MIVSRFAVLVALSTLGTASALSGKAPADGGRALFNQHCSMCHKLDNATNQHLTDEQWRAIMARMINNGAQITPVDQQIIVAFLINNYGASQSIEKKK